MTNDATVRCPRCGATFEVVLMRAYRGLSHRRDHRRICVYCGHAGKPSDFKRVTPDAAEHPREGAMKPHPAAEILPAPGRAGV
jgi:hypothetical protein